MSIEVRERKAYFKAGADVATQHSVVCIFVWIVVVSASRLFWPFDVSTAVLLTGVGALVIAIAAGAVAGHRAIDVAERGDVPQDRY